MLPVAGHSYIPRFTCLEDGKGVFSYGSDTFHCWPVYLSPVLNSSYTATFPDTQPRTLPEPLACWQTLSVSMHTAQTIFGHVIKYGLKYTKTDLKKKLQSFQKPVFQKGWETL